MCQDQAGYRYLPYLHSRVTEGRLLAAGCWLLLLLLLQDQMLN